MIFEKEINGKVETVYNCESMGKYVESPIMGNISAQKPKTINKDVPTADQIRKALNAANPMMKAYILIATSSGLSVSDIVNLKIKDIKNIDDNGITTLEIIRRKTSVRFYTFFSPEATDAVKQYLEIRNGDGTRRGIPREKWQIKHRVNSDDDYLFIMENIPDTYIELVKEDYEKAENLRKMSEYNFEDSFRYLSQKLKMGTEKVKFNILRTYNFQKYFITTLVDNGMGIMDVHFLAGREPPAEFKPYFIPDELTDEEINIWKDKYMKHLNMLMFKEKVIDVAESEHNQLKGEMIDLEDEIKELEEKIAKYEGEIRRLKHEANKFS